MFMLGVTRILSLPLGRCGCAHHTSTHSVQAEDSNLILFHTKYIFYLNITGCRTLVISETIAVPKRNNVGDEAGCKI